MIGVALAARVALSLVFLTAGVVKLAHLRSFERAVSQYELLPIRFVRPFARTLPVLEVVAALMLLLGFGIVVGAVLSAALLLAFSVAIAINLARGRDIDCGCSSSSAVAPERITWIHVARNVGLAGVALLVAWQWPRDFAIDAVLSPGGRVGASSSAATVIAATCVFVLSALVKQLVHGIRVLPEVV